MTYLPITYPRPTYPRPTHDLPTHEELEETIEETVVYTNSDHDPDATQPWNEREHFRFRGQEESTFTLDTCMSPLPRQMPLSPPSRLYLCKLRISHCFATPFNIFVNAGGRRKVIVATSLTGKTAFM